MKQGPRGGIRPAAAGAGRAVRTSFPGPAARAASPLGWAALVLLVASLAGACTVRLELAERRAIAGDLSASSAGLAAQERWLADRPGETLQPTDQGITIAAVMPRHPTAGPIELLPAAGGRSATRAAAVTTPASPAAPVPALRPDGTAVLARAAPPLPSPAKPVLLAAPHLDGPAPGGAGDVLVIEGLLPAAGPLF
ncbi:MAG TPA: hypothetical protein VFZ01_09030 [Geminicoccaceae bacterium]